MRLEKAEAKFRPYVAWKPISLVSFRSRQTVAQVVGLLSFMLVVVGSFARPKTAWAAELSAPTLGPQMAVVPGTSGASGCLPRPVSQDVLRDLIIETNAALGLDPQFAVVFSLDIPTCADLFYVAVENDVQGIGYQHLFESELFDESPDTRLQGVAFLNDIPYWDEHPEELQRAFLHELGHRWGARVQVGGADPDLLLGRDREHWSYFLDTSSELGVSPLEGNAWSVAEGAVASVTRGEPPAYSALDLYLMGLVPADAVGPLTIVHPDPDADLPDDCRGAIIRATSPPQVCEDLALVGSTQQLSVSDIIAVEGERSGGVSGGDATMEVGFYFLSPEGVWTQESCESWSEHVVRLGQAFSDATRGRLTLENVTVSQRSCSELIEAIQPPVREERARGCSYEAAGPSRGAGWICLVLLLLAPGARRARHKKVPG